MAHFTQDMPTANRAVVFIFGDVQKGYSCVKLFSAKKTIAQVLELGG